MVRLRAPIVRHSGSVPDDDPNAIAYDEALRLIAGQESALDNLRARAGTVLTVASISTSFLGAQALRQPKPFDDGWTQVAILSFVALAALSLVLLLPYKWVGFYRSPKIIVADYIEAEDPVKPFSTSEMRRDLALHIEKKFEKHSTRMAWLFVAFALSCALVIVETVAWLYELEGVR
jgi:hypothetical protein